MKNLHDVATTPARDSRWQDRFYADVPVFNRFANDVEALHPYQMNMYRAALWQNHPEDDGAAVAVAVIRDWERSAANMMRFGPRDRVALTCTRPEWYAIRAHMPFPEFERIFGPQGVEPSYRGIPVVIR